jgi:hypothetical protein
MKKKKKQRKNKTVNGLRHPPEGTSQDTTFLLLLF